MKKKVIQAKEYIEKIIGNELTRYEALVWLKENYHELSLHDLSLLTDLIDRPHTIYQLEKEKIHLFFTSLEDD